MLPVTGVARCLMYLNRTCCSLLPAPAIGLVLEAYRGGGCVLAMSKMCLVYSARHLERQRVWRKALVERKEIAPVVDILRLVTRAACLVLAEPLRASALCSPSLQSFCCVSSLVLACLARCWTYRPRELLACQEACLVLQLPCRLLAVSVRKGIWNHPQAIATGNSHSPLLTLCTFLIFHPCFWVGSLLLVCAVEMVQDPHWTSWLAPRFKLVIPSLPLLSLITLSQELLR